MSNLSCFCAVFQARICFQLLQILLRLGQCFWEGSGPVIATNIGDLVKCTESIRGQIRSLLLFLVQLRSPPASPSQVRVEVVCRLRRGHSRVSCFELAVHSTVVEGCGLVVANHLHSYKKLLLWITTIIIIVMMIILIIICHFTIKLETRNFSTKTSPERKS